MAILENEQKNRLVSPHEKPKTLLLVEDEIIIAMLEQRQLTTEGYRVLIAASGEKAIELVCEKNEPVDLILMDINLGAGMDGTETAREILKKHNIPVVFLSSHIERAIVRKTEEITSYGYVVKNSEVTVLDASIKMAFKLFEANKQTEDQKEQLRTILYSIGDAVIAVDIKGMIINMNPVAEKLTGWTYNAVSGKLLNTVFNIVNAQTRQQCRNPVDLVLASGKIVGLANHTLLISRDGTEYQIADSGSPIKDTAGNITGVVLVFRDVTQEYAIRKKIEKSEKIYRSLFENMLNGFAYCKMLYADGKPDDFTYLSVNSSFEQATGLKNVIGRKVSEIIPGIRETDPELLRIYGRVALSGNPEHFEIYVDSLKMWFAVSVYSPQKEYFVAIFDVITERKQVEEKLKESEAFLNNIIDQSPYPMWISDAAGTLIRINKACLDMLCITLDDVLGKYNIFDDNIVEAQGYMPLIRNVFEKGETARFELSYNSAQLKVLALENYTHVVLDITVFPVRNDKGTITNAVIQEINITDRKMAEKELVAANNALEALFHSSPLAIISLDPGGNVTRWNPAAERMFGWRKEEVLGRFLPIVPGDKYGEHHAMRMSVLNGKSFADAEVCRRRKDGSPIFISISTAPLYDGTGNVAGIMSVSADITKRRSAEQRLRESEALFRGIFEQAAVGVAQMNTRTGEFVQINRKFCDIVGYTPDEMKHITFQAITHPDDIAPGQDILQRFLAGEIRTFTIEKRYYHKDGSLVWVSITASPMWAAGEEPDYHISVVQDITERKLAEARVQKLLQEKELILKEVHHRVKNNMNTISSLLTIQADAQEHPLVKNILQDAAGRIRSMRVLYDKLYQSDNSGSISIREYFPVLIAEIVNLFPGKTGVKIRTELVDLSLDARMLTPLGIILNELITNAMKYAFTGRKDGEITLTVSTMGKRVALQFEDNGAGMAAAIPVEDSTGFGLQLVEMLVKQINGTMTIENRQGTKFNIEFLL